MSSSLARRFFSHLDVRQSSPHVQTFVYQLHSHPKTSPTRRGRDPVVFQQAPPEALNTHPRDPGSSSKNGFMEAKYIQIHMNLEGDWTPLAHHLRIWRLMPRDTHRWQKNRGRTLRWFLTKKWVLPRLIGKHLRWEGFHTKHTKKEIHQAKQVDKRFKPHQVKLWQDTWVFPKIRVPQNGWFITENPIKIDDLAVTTIFGNTHIYPQ